MKKMIFIGSAAPCPEDNCPPINGEVYAKWIKVPFFGCPHGGWLVKGYEYGLDNEPQWFYKEELAEPMDTKEIANEFTEVIERPDKISVPNELQKQTK